MFFNDSNYNSEVISTINTINSIIDDTNKELDKLKFTRQCMIEKLLYEIHSITTYPITYGIAFYQAINDYLNRKEKPLPKGDELKEKYGKFTPKSCYEILLEDLQNHISSNIKSIDKIVWMGYNNYGVCVYFNVNNNTYYLTIPIIKNISIRELVYETNDYNETNNYIDYDIAKFKLFIQDGTYSWKLVKASYNLDDLKID